MNATQIINHRHNVGHARPRQLRGLSAGCPIIDRDAMLCDFGGMEISCKQIRECDGITGNVHVEYALPEASPNVNIWQLQGDGTFEYINPTAPPPTPPPTLNFRNTPNPYDDPTFFKQVSPTAPPPAPPPTAPTQPRVTTPTTGLNPSLISPTGSPLTYGGPGATLYPQAFRQPGLPTPPAPSLTTLITTATRSSSNATNTSATGTTPATPETAAQGASSGLLRIAEEGYDWTDNLLPGVPGWAWILAAAAGTAYLLKGKR